MNVALRVVWTLESFLEWEERQQEKYEFDGKQPVAMAGGTEAHAEIQFNLAREVGLRLNKPPCRIIGSELKLVGKNRSRYPDAMILCSPRDAKRAKVSDPVIVFEILSESTAETDLIDKNEEYSEIPSIQRYVILKQTEAMAIVYARRDGEWVPDKLRGRDAMLRLPEVDVELSLDAIYGSVDV